MNTEPLEPLEHLKSSPLVSVIIATYNRSNILQYTIETVRKQSHQNFEIIVIGDHCTDDTAEVIDSFNDRRITFYNLPENFGEQSFPNNTGFNRSKGEFIAWLNHDDLWFPDHLEILLRGIVEKGADLVYAWNFSLRENQAAHDCNLPVYTYPPRFLPFFSVPASTWLVKRSTIERVGLWKSAKDLHVIPSFDWISRVHEMKLSIEPVPKLTVITIQSGHRKNSYAERQYKEHSLIYGKMFKPGFREELLHELCTILAFRRNRVTVTGYFSYLIKKPIIAVIIFLDYNFVKLFFKIRYKKGAYIKTLRKKRGLSS